MAYIDIKFGYKYYITIIKAYKDRIDFDPSDMKAKIGLSLRTIEPESYTKGCILNETPIDWIVSDAEKIEELLNPVMFEHFKVIHYDIILVGQGYTYGISSLRPFNELV